MKYRKITALTDAEIKYILKELLYAVKVTNISRNEEHNEVYADVTTEWETDSATGEVSLITDEVVLDETTVNVPYTFTHSDKILYQKYLLAKGCNALLKDNPYLTEELK